MRSNCKPVPLEQPGQLVLAAMLAAVDDVITCEKANKIDEEYLRKILLIQ